MSRSFEELLNCSEQSLVVAPDNESHHEHQPESVECRLCQYHPAHHQKDCGVDEGLHPVETEGHIIAGVDNSCPEAEVVAEESCDRSALYAPFRDEEEVEDDIRHTCGETCPEGVLGVFCGGIDTAEKLVKAHEQHGNYQHGGVHVNVAVFAEFGGADEYGRDYLNACDEKSGGNEEQSFICAVDFFIELAAVFGVVLHNGGHIPRLEENSRDHGDEVGDFGGIAVDAGSTLSESYLVAVHIADEESVRETCYHPHNDRRYQRDSKPHKAGSETLVVVSLAEELMKSGDDK